MLNNISVTKKGLAAFGLLALLAIGASAVIYDRATTTTTIVENNQRIIGILDETVALDFAITAQNLAMKNFLLTGDRSYVTAIEEASTAIEGQIRELAARYEETAADAKHHIDTASTIWTTWKTDVIEKQILLMRDPMTVDLARAMELTGDGSRLVGETHDAIVEATSALRAIGDVASADQKSALDLMELISLASAIAVALFAALLAFLNFRLISRPLSVLTGVTARLADGDLDVDVTRSDRADEIGRMNAALVVFRENLLRTRALEIQATEDRRRAEEIRRQAMIQVASDLEASVGAVSDEIVAASRRLNDAAGTLAGIAAGTTERAMSVSSSSEQTTANVQTVASATEELSASISEVNDAVRASTRIAADAVREVERSGNAIAALNSVVDRIGDVTTLINDIAAQTNLLALNATIEAARAARPDAALPSSPPRSRPLPARPPRRPRRSSARSAR
ncbi:Methyl-accepting chemotaxis protein 3 [Methylobrevis pamukkalensis]|uniref:Methyl-accepting chemotaxis protein 3 n=1 Tax=Methylobrevis pamukkalensis TaxID=1439726 RepID=A0A1E3GXS4_9HYPH|nr:Methyl-accepting chemotaxis protein 3 [Methylobrevis pamukkalensis]